MSQDSRRWKKHTKRTDNTEKERKHETVANSKKARDEKTLLPSRDVVSTCNEFLPWLQQKAGIEISSVLTIGNSIYGRSLFASKFIQAGDCILKVPFSVQLTPDNVLPEIRSLLGDNVGNVARLAIVLLVERKMGEDSGWAPYISSLPQAGELHSTIFWSKKELEMVRQSPVYKETINQQTQIEKEFLAIRPALDRFPQIFEDITFKDFLHAYAVVGSRAWGSSKGLSLIPFADFLNHDGYSEALLLGDEHKQVSEVIADRDYDPGEQVLIRYGKFSNSTLLVDFGFTISYNTYDQVQIWVSIPEHDPLRIMKLELLDKHRMQTITNTNDVDSSGHSFIIKEVRSSRGKGKGIPQSLRAFVRVLSASSPQELKDLEMEAAKNDGRLARRPLKDMSREIQAHQILLSQIVHLIQEYDASIKRLRPVNLPSIDRQLSLRRRMAHDLLTGELRVLKSAYAWLTSYCYTLSTGNVHPSAPG
ncbi:SET domain [Macleaya cordata]|uniref:SET domain n=1 Tax=Macleaya cordata TaxID=56857 RepID=A0A200R6B8_MACCD|nr:SET domain [Macleaya cordata]